MSLLDWWRFLPAICSLLDCKCLLSCQIRHPLAPVREMAPQIGGGVPGSRGLLLLQIANSRIASLAIIFGGNCLKRGPGLPALQFRFIWSLSGCMKTRQSGGNDCMSINQHVIVSQSNPSKGFGPSSTPKPCSADCLHHCSTHL